MGWFWICMAICLAVTWYDWKTTQDAIGRGGKESNPVVAWIVEKIGWKNKLWLDMGLVVTFGCLALVVSGWPVAVTVLVIFTLFQGAAAITNWSVGK